MNIILFYVYICAIMLLYFSDPSFPSSRRVGGDGMEADIDPFNPVQQQQRNTGNFAIWTSILYTSRVAVK